MHSSDKNKSIITRRSFLGTAGMAFGASALGPVIPALNSVLSAKTYSGSISTVNLGVLMPESHIYPHLADNFYNGLLIYQKEMELSGKPIHLNLIPVQYGFGPSSALKNAKMLLQENNVDLLTGIVSQTVSQDMRDLLAKNNKLLIANHTGANLLEKQDYSPRILHNSLHMYKSNYTLAAWAAKNIGKNAVVLSSFYESGYDALFAFKAGFEKHGGKIADTQIINIPGVHPEPNILINMIRHHKPDVVFASFSGKEASQFFQDQTGSPLVNQIPILVSAFTINQPQSVLKHDFSGRLMTCASWSNEIREVFNTKHVASLQQINTKRSDIFTILGYETAAIIHTALVNNNGSLTGLNSATELLPEKYIASPRGKLQLNQHTLELESPLYLQDPLQKGIIESVAGENRYVGSPAQNELKSGWLNPYLCA